MSISHDVYQAMHVTCNIHDICDVMTSHDVMYV